MITLLLTLIDTEDSKAYCLGHILALIICFIKLLHMHTDGSYEMSQPLWLLNTTHRQMMLLKQNKNELWLFMRNKISY